MLLYGKVLDQPLGDVGNVIRSKKPRKLPVVLTHDEAMRIIGELNEPINLIASLMYGAGLRVTEACRLRIKDLPGSSVARNFFTRSAFLTPWPENTLKPGIRWSGNGFFRRPLSVQIILAMLPTITGISHPFRGQYAMP